MKITYTFTFLLLAFSLFSQLEADFTINKTSACVGELITVTSTSTPGSFPITNYIWSAQGADIESAEGADLTSFSFTYSNPGTYNLGLIIQDQNGVAVNEFKIDALVIHPNPEAQANSIITSCISPFNVTYNSAGSSSGNDFVYTWSFPGASPTSATGTSVNTSYSNAGTYTATLTVINNLTTCKAIATKSVTLENYIADFIVPSSACSGQSFTFTDNSSPGTNQWSWSTSSGQNSSSSQNFTTVINGNGNIDVTLIATNTSTGCSDQVTKTINIKPLPNPSFTANPVFGCAATNVTFTNTSATSGASFVWNFGDGTAAFSGTTPPVHTYLQNNILYFPTLTMTGSNGCSNSYTGDTIYFLPPEANFKLDIRDGCAPVLVQFTDQSFSPAAITSWKWNFDDGTSSTLQNPSHTFQCGIFDVQLVITIQGGCTDTVNLSDQVLNTFLPNGLTTVSDITQLSFSSSTVERAHINLGDNDHSYPTIRYGEIVSTDFTYDPPVNCGNLPFTFESIANFTCPPDNDIQYKWSFEGFNPISAPDITTDPTKTKIFLDTLKTDTPMDVGLEIDYRGCISPRTDKLDIIYLKAPISRFFVSDPLFCNQGPGPH